MNQTLRDHQLMMLEMLSEVDRICKKHNIRYMLFAGTLLGAVRHKGFIPWDDDLDIVMLRPEYERFLEIAKDEINQTLFYLQSEFSPHWPMFFSKIRRNGTACIERYIPKDFDTHMGVYIDIFPCDNLHDNRFLRYLQFMASKIVIAKGLDERGYATNSSVKKAFIVFSRMMPKKILIRLVTYKRGKNTKMVHTFFAASSKYSKNIFPRDWFLQTVPVSFEGRYFPAPLQYSVLLTQLYEDYTIPTPPDKRGQKVHGEIVDLEHSYTEYREIQEHLTIDEYTRSIR